MSKSTPLSQLPQNAGSQPPAPMATLPAPTKQETEKETLPDDEATIQEVLNQINMSMPSPQPPQQLQQPSAMPFPTAPQMSQSPQTPYYPADMYMQAAMQGNVPSTMPPVVPGNQALSTMDMFFTMFADDVKLALLVFACVIVVHFIPASTILNKYIAIDKIPYHEVILRAIMCAALVIILKMLFVK